VRSVKPEVACTKCCVEHNKEVEIFCSPLFRSLSKAQQMKKQDKNPPTRVADNEHEISSNEIATRAGGYLPRQSGNHSYSGGPNWTALEPDQTIPGAPLFGQLRSFGRAGRKEKENQSASRRAACSPASRRLKPKSKISSGVGRPLPAVLSINSTNAKPSLVPEPRSAATSRSSCPIM
jgi:hypothetical protein